MDQRRLLSITAGIVALLVTALCLLTMNRSLGFIDQGELAAAASVLGVPHPTGYPLLMILGHVATLLIPVRDVLALNILAALMVGAGAGVLTLLFDYLLRRIPGETREKAKGGRNVMVTLSAGIGALLTALTAIWWGEGTIFEAYALHALLLPLTILTFLRYLDMSDEASRTNGWSISRQGFIFSLVLGLAFSNHMMTILLAPAFLYLFFVRFGLSSRTFTQLSGLIPGFLLGLLPYLYLPLRAAANPPVNWGRVTTLPRFLDHVTGAQFRGLMQDGSVIGDQLGWYFSTLPGEFAWIGLALALFGLVMLFRRSLQLGIFTALLFLFCVFYAGTYAIKEIEPYFMTATLAVGVWAVVGVWEIMKRFGAGLGTGVGIITVLISLFMHYGKVDQSDNTMVEDLANNVLAPLPDNAVLLTTRWDIFLAGTMYLQYVEGFKPNVSVININMLHDRAYLSQVLEQNPEFKRVNKRIREFVNERKRFDQGEMVSRKDSLNYSRLFYRMINGIITTNKRPTFVTWEVDTLIGYRWNRTPVGLAYGLTVDSTYLDLPRTKYHFALPEYRMNPDVMSAAVFYARAELAHAAYEEKFGKPERAALYVERAARYDPEIDPDDIPVLPMGNQKYMRESAEFFERLK